jgi:hypothetical protein
MPESEYIKEVLPDLGEMILNSDALKEVSLKKRSDLIYLLSTDVYRDALKDQPEEDVHMIIKAVLGNSPKTRSSPSELVKRFSRLVKYQAFHSPTDEQALENSNSFSFLEYTYSLPDLFLVSDPDELERELFHLLNLCEAILSILVCASLIAKEIRKGFSQKLFNRKKKEYLHDCKSQLDNYSFLKEKGFHLLLCKWGVQINIFPSKLYKEVIKLSKITDLKAHIHRFTTLKTQIEDVLKKETSEGHS